MSDVWVFTRVHGVANGSPGLTIIGAAAHAGDEFVTPEDVPLRVARRRPAPAGAGQ